ncbi:HD-GYP domain-containing protein [Paenibacillus ehimensis]|uniref:HD-GYP domain-containing protein n=1 Tax=Paenibacillus ehimensis TaxID=79264 RepID=UPI0004701FCE|nr:HD-GYP domain-containing protein [Paenibacillus ehimensis]MEC0212218.1 HD-GYP domain-containing protein [Paenibacillus ehimensis]
MRLLPTRSCEPGMRLGKCIYSEEGVILLNEGVELTGGLIGRLERLGIDYLYIADKATEDLKIEEPLADETRIRALTEIRTHFRSFMENESRSKFSKNHVLGRSFGNVMKMIIDDLNEKQGTAIMLLNMNVLNNYLYQHSLNVCIYATMLGMVSGYNKDELMALGLGALLHDIGKTKINLEIIKKPGPLTPEEFEEVKKHAEIGFRLLKDEPNMPLLSAHCAFQHHERENGSGYPRGITGKDIHEYAKWIAVADSYDAMTTHRPHRLAMLPHQAMEVLFAGVGTLYDQRKVAMFRDNVAIYPLGLTVTLSTGEQGVVVNINPAVPQRPVVRVLIDAYGQVLGQPYEIDLAEKLTVFIDHADNITQARHA